MKHKVKHIHFVGIGGVGMSGIAEVLSHLGYTISGSDQSNNTTTARLSAMGIAVHFGHDASYIHGADVVVTSTAVKADNPEVVAANDSKIPVIPRAMMLAELMRFKSGIAIAGTHGKTTTTSLTASILAAAGMDPTFVIGGKLTAAGSNAKLGLGDYIVAEADESDASFLHLSPVLSVVTNIDEDHMDTYDHDVEKLYQAFLDFLNGLPFYGCAFLCIESEHVRNILPRIKKPYKTYGLSENADIYAKNIQAVGTSMHFTTCFKDAPGDSFDIVLNAPGEHNVLNSLAAIGVALECHAPVEAIVTGLRGFAGVGRRFQSYGQVALPSGGEMTLIDDYGHHPVEMAATLAAVRNAFPGRRLVLAFQPHRYSRTRDLFEDFVSILKGVDALILTEVYAAGEVPVVAADSRALARAIRVSGKLEPVFVENIQDVPEAILSFAQDNDVVITMGAGSIGGVPQKIVTLGNKE